MSADSTIQGIRQQLEAARRAASELLVDVQDYFDRQCHHLSTLGDLDGMAAVDQANPQQWIDAARLQLQTGFMMAERAIEQPGEF